MTRASAPKVARLILELRRAGITDERVLGALERVPRDRFVPASFADRAWENTALPIEHSQTISQPLVVALMTEALKLGERHKLLEIGTGSGYQAAILSALAKEVYTIEIVPELARSAAQTLAQLGYKNVSVREGDGYKGWPEKAPFDRILLTAAPPELPAMVVSQLRPGGTMVAPVGANSSAQQIVVLSKARDGKITTRSVLPVRFVPMVTPR